MIVSSSWVIVCVKIMQVIIYFFRYFQNETKEEVVCTFPRLLTGEPGFVECKNFTTHYSCPSNTSNLSERTSVCDLVPCNDCEQSQISYGAGPGFKCQSNFQYCVLPQVLLYDNVPDCADGEDLCFERR